MATDSTARKMALSQSGGGGTSDYIDLTNKPKINNITLSENKTSADLDIPEKTKMFYPNNQYGGIVSENFDTIVLSGFYTGYGTATGVPNADYSWFVYHHNSNVGTTSAYQKAIAYSTELIAYERTKITDTWGDWVLVDSGGEDYTLDNAKLSVVLSGATAETMIEDTDTVPFTDVSVSNSTKKITWANIKARLKTYFDTLYNNYALPTASTAVLGGVKVDGSTITITDEVIKATSNILITDTNNYFTSGNVEGALSEVGVKMNELEGYIWHTSSDIYGVEVDVVNKTFTRLAGAVGKTEGADFNSINAFGGRKRCNLTDSGVVTAYYGETAYTETGALTQQIIKNGITYPIGTKVQVMVEQPKFYYKVVPLKLDKIEGGKGFHNRKARYYVSDTPRTGFKLHPAFVSNNVSKNFVYLSAYEGSLYDTSASDYILDDAQVADFVADKLSSIANAKPASGLTQDLTRANTRKLAQNRGIGWQQAYASTISASQLLMLIEYATFNMQSAIGQGAVNKAEEGSINMAENTGVTITLGNASGTASNANGVQFVTYRGEENFWGNIWGWVDGLNQYFDAENKTSTIYIADHGFTDGTNATPYEDAGITPSLTNGYVSAFCYSEDYDWLFIGSEVLGDSSLPVGDYFWQTKTTGWRVAWLGAKWNVGLDAGAFCWNLGNASSSRYLTIGGRLVYVPSAIA